MGNNIEAKVVVTTPRTMRAAQIMALRPTVRARSAALGTRTSATTSSSNILE
jgi:hypothetical protein